MQLHTVYFFTSIYIAYTVYIAYLACLPLSKVPFVYNNVSNKKHPVNS